MTPRSPQEPRVAERTASGRATILDVARAAKVSRQTVSNVVNRPGRVASDTLARVQVEIDRLGFRPSRAAATLRQERAGAWGIELGSRGAGRLGSVLDPFLVRLTAHARRHDSYIVPFTAADAGPLAAYEDVIASRIADGFVLTDTRKDDPRPAWLRDNGIPFAAFGRVWDDPTITSWVDVDGAAGVERAVHHLVAEGYERLGFLGWPVGSPVGDDRRSGWARTTADLGIANAAWDGYASQDLSQAASAAAPVVDAVGRGGAIVCASDVLAVGVWEVLAARGWVTGADFGLVGFDDTDLAQSLRLTSLRQPLSDIAEYVLDLLGAPEGSGAPPAGTLLEPELVTRASSSRAGDRRTERGTS